MDEAYLIGTPKPIDSYLRSDRILDVAHKTKAEAVHPGYGFLSENAKFVNQLEAEKIVSFIDESSCKDLHRSARKVHSGDGLQERV